MLGGDSDSEGAEDLSAGELAAIRKREEEMLKLDSGDEKPLQYISKRKKRRSIDSTTKQMALPSNAKSDKKRTQSQTKSHTGAPAKTDSPKSSKPNKQNREQNKSKRKTESSTAKE
jgi:Ulp1 family protease